MTLRIAKSVVVFLAALAAVNSYALMPKTRSQNLSEQKLPFSAEAERSVLGAVLLQNDAILKVMPVLREDDFFGETNRKIYRGMIELASSGKAIDPVTLGEILKNDSAGAAYLMQLTDGLPRATNVKFYAEIIAKKAKLRAVIHACNEVMQSASDDADAAELTESAISRFLSLTGERDESTIREWNEVADSAISQIDEARKNPKSVCRINAGIKELDEMTAGLRKKELSMIVGMPGHGKSLIAEEFATTADDDGYKGIIFSAEMSGESIVLRQLSYESDTFLYHLRRPDSITPERFENLKLAAKRERQLPIVDRGITPDRVFVMSEARKRTKGLDFVIVDYDQLVIGAGMSKSADPEMFFARQGDFIIKSKELAKRLDIAFILLAQPRKTPPGIIKGRKWKPSLDDIYGHSAMRNAPDVVMWVVREFFIHGLDKKYERKATVHVLKARNDQTGHVAVEFDPQRVRFLDKKAETETEED